MCVIYNNKVYIYEDLDLISWRSFFLFLILPASVVTRLDVEIVKAYGNYIFVDF